MREDFIELKKLKEKSVIGFVVANANSKREEILMTITYFMVSIEDKRISGHTAFFYAQGEKKISNSSEREMIQLIPIISDVNAV